MNREELNNLTKEDLIQEYLDLQEDNAWWQRRYNAEHKIAFEIYKPKIEKAIEYIKENCTNYYVEKPNYRGVELINIEELLEILGDKE